MRAQEKGGGKGNGQNRVRRRILIVDDHPVVRQGLAELLRQEPDLLVVGEAADAHEALDLIASRKPELAIVDLSLKGGSGLDLVKNIATRHSDLRMLVLSMHDEALYAERALRAGAKGYIMKGEATRDLLAAVRRILDGKIYLSERMSNQLLEKAAAGKRPSPRAPMGSLSDRELEVFEMIGRGLGTSEIARRLHLSVKTVETHRAKIKEKLDLKTAPQLVQHAVTWMKSV